jgi:Domain of unknown function (DUF4349)
MRAPDTLPPDVERDLAAMDAAVAGRPHPGGDRLLAELAALVAESRPELEPARARRIDQRVAARRIRRRHWKWNRALVPAAALAACAVIAVVIGLSTNGRPRPDLTAGAGGGGSAGSSTSGGSGASSAAGTAETAPAVPARPPGSGDPRSDSRTARKVDRSATMTLGAPGADIDSVADGVARVATTLGGFVASSSISSGSGGDLELRIPSGRLDDAIDRLGRLAHVRQLERSTLDITALSVSARARIADLTAERRSVLRQLARATTLDETDRLKARLRSVNGRLQAARAQSRRIDNRAAYASLSVQLVPEHRSGATGAWSPGDAWHDALRVLEVAAGIALVAFAVALPLALLGLPAWLAGRRLTRRRRERALELA